MKTFEYTITDALGIHARPAGLLAKEGKKFSSVCTITKGEQTKKLTQLMMLMNMGIKQGDTVSISFKGLHIPMPKFSGIYNETYGLVITNR